MFAAKSDTSNRQNTDTTRIQESPLSSNRRASCRSYCIQLLALVIFYSGGLWFTLRFFVEHFVLRSRVPLERQRQRLAHTLLWFFQWLEKRKVFQLDVSDVQNLSQQRSTIFAANHPGLFDALVILAHLPEVVCLMRAGLMRNPFIRGAALANGFIPNDVGADFVRLAISNLERGENLLIFPEGTRTDPQRALNAFKRGFALVSIKSKAPILPLLIEQEGDFFRKGVPFFRPTAVPVTIRIRVGEPIHPGEEESVDQLTERVRSYYYKALSGCRDDSSFSARE